MGTKMIGGVEVRGPSAILEKAAEIDRLLSK